MSPCRLAVILFWIEGYESLAALFDASSRVFEIFDTADAALEF